MPRRRLQGSTNGDVNGAERQEEEETGVRVLDGTGSTSTLPPKEQIRTRTTIRNKKETYNVFRGNGVSIAQPTQPTEPNGVPLTGPRLSSTPLVSPTAAGIALGVNAPQLRPGVAPLDPGRTSQGIVRSTPSRTSQGVAIGGQASAASPNTVQLPTGPKQTQLYVSPEVRAARAAGLAEAVKAADVLLSTPSAAAAAAPPLEPKEGPVDTELAQRKKHCTTEVQRMEAHIADLRLKDEKLKLQAQAVAAAAPQDASPEEVLGSQLRDMWEETRGSQQVARTRADLVTQVHKAVTRRWSGHGLVVAPFGSSITGLAGKDSDVDLVLLDPMRPLGVGTPEHLRQPSQSRTLKTGQDGLPDYYSVYALGSCLKNAGFVDVSTVAHASVPIVKFTHKASGLQLDLNVNDRFGLSNSALLRTYAELRPDLVRPLMFAVKTWAKRRALNDPAGATGAATFSSYALALMVIQYLQSSGDLPNLQSPELLAHLGIPKQRLFKDNRTKSRSSTKRAAQSKASVQQQQQSEEIPYDCTFAVISEPSPLAPYKVDSQDARERDVALGAAWTGFAKWLKGLDGKIVSVANGTPMKRRLSVEQNKNISADDQGEPSALPRQGEQQAQEHVEEPMEEEDNRVVSLDNFVEPRHWQERPFIVQDPFILDRNCTGSILGRVLTERLTTELKRTIQLSTVPIQTFGDLMQDVRFSAAQAYLNELHRELAALEALQLSTDSSIAKRQVNKVKAAAPPDFLRASSQANRGGTPLNNRHTLPERPGEGAPARRFATGVPQQQQNGRGTMMPRGGGGLHPQNNLMPRHGHQTMHAPAVRGFRTQGGLGMPPQMFAQPQMPFQGTYAPSPQEFYRSSGGGGGAPDGPWRGGAGGGRGARGGRGASYRGARGGPY